MSKWEWAKDWRLDRTGNGRVYLVKLNIQRRGRVEHIAELNEFVGIPAKLNAQSGGKPNGIPE